jgi:hypothetical protein
MLLVVRSKLVPDFALTVHIIHLAITWAYSHSIPTSMFWWGLQATSTAVMTFLGIWACQWRELKPISFGFGGGGTRGNADVSNSRVEERTGFLHGQGDHGDDTLGFELVEHGSQV